MDETPGGSGTPKAKSENSGVPWGVLLLVALLLIGVYVVTVFWLFLVADDKGVGETVWGRYTYLLVGFEAIVFTAVGWLFGREVNRKQAEQAEQATDDAKKEGKDAATAKAKGEALKAAIFSATEQGATTAAVQPDPMLLLLREQASRTEF